MAGKRVFACGMLSIVLDGIETGYEAKFDFPVRAGPPECAYLLATVPRTGSTWVSHILWRSGCLGAPLEYLNFLESSPYAFAHGQPERQKELWRSALRRRTSPNGVFGVKCFSQQLRELQRDNPSLLLEVFATVFPKGCPAKVLRLKRRDAVAHAISYARAALSGVWHKVQETPGGPRVDYSGEAIDRARALLGQQEAEWDLLFKELRIEPLTLWYEDVLQQPGDAIERIASFLGVDLDPAAQISVPDVEKQAQDGARLWAERYSSGEPRR